MEKKEVYYGRGYRKGARSEPLFFCCWFCFEKRGGVDHRRLLLAVGTVSLHLTGLLETQNPKCPRPSPTCKQANLSKRMIRDSARQKGWAKAKLQQTSRTPSMQTSICFAGPFFPFPSRTEKKSGTVACWRIMAPNPSHPVFLCPPSPVPPPPPLPPPLVLFCNAKEKGNACPSSIYGTLCIRTCT